MFTNIVVCDDLGIVVFKIFQQPVSEVDVCCSIGWGGVLFKEVADFEVEAPAAE